jgi:predicted RNA-binding protein YlxR (DUF448 family)
MRTRGTREQMLPQENRGSPERTCVGCRRKAPVTELVRIHPGPDGLLSGPGPGRGAWLCAAHPTACLDEAVRRRSLERALRTPVRMGELERLRARLADG